MITFGSPTTTESDRQAWDRFVAESPHGSVFLRSGFLDALDLQWEIARVGPAATPSAAAIILRDQGGQVVEGPAPFCQYHGVLFEPAWADTPAHRRAKESVERVAELLDGLVGEQRLSWCLHPRFTDIRAFNWFNYHAPEKGQFRIAIRYSGLIAVDRASGLAGVLEGSRSVRRQEYRKAAARFQVASVLDVDLLDHLHRLTFARQGLERPAREVRLLRSLASAALREGFGELLVAFDGDGTPAGAALFLFDNRVGYYLVAANDPQYRSAGVSTLLLMAGVERGIARGVSAIDVVGMNSPARGDFKASFGAEPVPYYVVDWARPW